MSTATTNGAATDSAVTNGAATVATRSITEVEREVWRLCHDLAARLQFHGWHHVSFVRDKAVHFARRNGSDVALVEVAALVHDVNYMVRRNSLPVDGRNLRLDILARAGVPGDVAARVDEVVEEAEMRTRHRDISPEAQALSDADTLFKALPVTPVVLAPRYLEENGITLRELAHKIVGEQRNKHDAGYYFYDPEAAATYSRWATANLELWSCIVESLDDPTVNDLLTAVS
ncbi:HD family phosphohydrolase [Saccharothrix longispora]|uniref:HD family phosphohydrolase n=1 Tax=Saccharothrix longispora TaxID=33920 RepID=UPI0028FD6E65|nr:HD family phosphohydrolase [Saccharothrix longispora]MDU0290361.1 HD family phosphohydrolase [Saccharothrix longispora]